MSSREDLLRQIAKLEKSTDGEIGSLIDQLNVAVNELLELKFLREKLRENLREEGQ